MNDDTGTPQEETEPMTAHDLARLMLDRLGDLATYYVIGDEALDYLESVRVELRPIAWPPTEYAWLYEPDDNEDD